MTPLTASPKTQGAAGLPAEVEAPADPQGARAQIGRGEQKREYHGDGEAGVVRSRRERLHDGVDGRKTQRGSRRPYRADKALEGIAAKGDLLSQRGQRKECRIGHEPAPRGTLSVDRDGDAADHRHGQHADQRHGPSGCQAQSGLAEPAGTPRQSLRADGVCLPVEPETHGRIAEQEQKDQHGLIDQRKPRIAGQSLGAVVRPANAPERSRESRPGT